MDCAEVASHLVGYQLGAVTDDERDAVEGHLVGCSDCVKTYLALKRAADQAVATRPRPEVKARLRAEVLRAFPRERGTWSTRTRAIFAQRIPLYQGFALAAVAAALALAAPRLLERIPHPEEREVAPALDTSRTRAESLRIY